MVSASSALSVETYEGQFGTFVITDDDRREVIIYRCGLAVAAFSFALGVSLMSLGNGSTSLLWAISACYLVMWLGLGVSLWFIHIYLRPLHQALQVFWLIGGIASVGIVMTIPGPLALSVYERPLSMLGVGFTFAALTGIYFKEAFCFNRLETKLLVPLVPSLLLTHMVEAMPNHIGRGLLVTWAILFVIFALRKLVQPIPPDIGDKSVFDYLKQQRQASA